MADGNVGKAVLQTTVNTVNCLRVLDDLRSAKWRTATYAVIDEASAHASLGPGVEVCTGMGF